MIRNQPRLALVGIALLAALPGLAADTVTLDGGFVWNSDDGKHEGDLKAILTPTGEGTWSVAFHFDWEDGPHVYTGTCTGALGGDLSGEVTSDGERKMQFTISGAFEGGTFNGTHNFVTKEGEAKPAGTLSLNLPKS
jgi:hypothetical protein